jgi:hypothetical protein
MVERGLLSDTETHVQCLLCHRSYKAITYTHLKYKHGIEAPKSYKDEFSLGTITSREVREKVAAAKRIVGHKELEYIRKNWAKRPLSAIMDHLGVDASTIRGHAKSLGLPLYVQKWDGTKLISAILRAHRKGVPLHSASARKLIPQVYRSARKGKHFKTWKHAIEAAGLRYSQIARRRPFERWTSARIFQEIRALVRERRHLDYHFLQRKHSKLYAAARNHFINWQKAVRAAMRPT